MKTENSIVLPTQRHLFEIPDHIAYFNCAYNSPLLNASRDRLHTGVISKSHPWERTAESFFQDAETIRQLSAAIFGATSDHYAIVPSASYGISTAARAIEPGLQPGDQILVMEHEFPSNVLAWKRTAQVTQAELVTISEKNYPNWTAAILDHLNSKVKVLALSHCHWTNGAFIDLEMIAESCRVIGTALVIDATQSLGAMPIDLKKIKPDFLVAAGYKWLLGPYGFSLFYVDEKWFDARPLEETWLARDNALDFTQLVNYSDNYMSGARKFDVGEKCTPTILPGAIAALEQIKIWGVENIAHTLQQINDRIAQELEQLGFTLPEKSTRSPHMFGAKLPENVTLNLVSELSKNNIYISQRGNSLRFAPHLHINENDIHHFVDIIDRMIHR